MRTRMDGGTPIAPKTYPEQRYSSYRLNKLRELMGRIRDSGVERLTTEGPETDSSSRQWGEQYLLSTGAHYKQIFGEDLLSPKDLALLEPGLKARIDQDLTEGNLGAATYNAINRLVLFGDRSWTYEQEFAMFQHLETKLAAAKQEAQKVGPFYYRNERYYRNQEDVAKTAYQLRVLVGKSYRHIDSLVWDCIDSYETFVKGEMERDPYRGDHSGGESADHAAHHAVYSRVLAARTIQIIPGEGIQITD